MDTKREAAYRSLIFPITIADTARELGIPEDFIKGEITRKVLKSNGETIRGSDLADYRKSEVQNPK